MNKKIFVSSLLAGLFVASVVFASTISVSLNSDGNYLQWTPSSGTTHYTLVDEVTCNGTTDYNSTNTVGNRDSYGTNLAPLPNGSVITQIDISPCASQNSAGSSSSVLNVFYRLNGIDSSDSGSYALSGTKPSQLGATTFSGLSTMKTSTTTLELGAILSSGTKGARLSRLSASITYTPLSAPSNLTATPVSSSEIDLSWTDNTTIEDGFSIERALQSGPTCLSYTQIASTTANTVSYSDTGLSSMTSYCYRVKAFNFGGYSPASNVASSTTP